MHFFVDYISITMSAWFVFSEVGSAAEIYPPLRLTLQSHSHQKFSLRRSQVVIHVVSGSESYNLLYTTSGSIVWSIQLMGLRALTASICARRERSTVVSSSVGVVGKALANNGGVAVQI